jgi:hypothetical protein
MNGSWDGSLVAQRYSQYKQYAINRELDLVVEAVRNLLSDRLSENRSTRPCCLLGHYSIVYQVI